MAITNILISNLDFEILEFFLQSPSFKADEVNINKTNIFHNL